MAAAAKHEELAHLALRLPSEMPISAPPRPLMRTPPPKSKISPKHVEDAIPHPHDEDLVDVEQCSDGENEEKVKKSNNEGEKKPKRRKEDKLRVMKPKCNCPELMAVDCCLETKELWDKFNELGTEMIITKTGR